jgi:hypothetical protein
MDETAMVWNILYQEKNLVILPIIDAFEGLVEV